MTDYNIDDIKDGNPIEQIAQIAFSFKKMSGKYMQCVEHDSLVINPQTGFYHWNSKGESGDVIDFTARYILSLPSWNPRNYEQFNEVVDWLARRSNAPKSHDVSRKSKQEASPADATTFADVKFDLRRVEDWAAKGRVRAQAYWGKYWLADQVDEYRLGYLSFPVDGGKIYAGYTVPHMYHSPDGEIMVKAVNVRRDDLCPNNIMDDKYKSLTSSKLGGIYLDQYVTSPCGKRIGPPLDILCITEDEKSAMFVNMIMRDDPYIRGVADKPDGHWDPFMKVVTSNAQCVVILRDNETMEREPDFERYEGGYPGVEKALKLKRLIDRPNTRIITTSTHKQISDLGLEEGKVAAYSWLMAQFDEAFKYV